MTGEQKVWAIAGDEAETMILANSYDTLLEGLYPGEYSAASLGEERYRQRVVIGRRAAALGTGIAMACAEFEDGWSIGAEDAEVVAALLQRVEEPAAAVIWRWPASAPPVVVTTDQIGEREPPECDGVFVLVTANSWGLVSGLVKLELLKAGVL